jgi:hypothetical protein
MSESIALALEVQETDARAPYVVAKLGRGTTYSNDLFNEESPRRVSREAGLLTAEPPPTSPFVTANGQTFQTCACATSRRSCISSLDVCAPLPWCAQCTVKAGTPALCDMLKSSARRSVAAVDDNINLQQTSAAGRTRSLTLSMRPWRSMTT